MTSLRTVADLRSVLSYAESTLPVGDFGEVHPVVLAGLAQTVGSDTATLTHLDVRTGREVATFWPASHGQPSTLDRYAKVSKAHPLRPVLARQAGARGGGHAPARISEVMTRRAWRGSQLYRESHAGIADQMAVLLSARGSAMQVVTLSRFAGVFTDRQADLLRTCHPHVRAAVARSRRDQHVALQIAPTPMWVPASTAPGLVTESIVGGVDEPAVVLTPREVQVLALVAQGMTDAQIARRLRLSPATVSKHLTRIYRRAGLPNRAAAAELWSRRYS